MNKDGFTPDFFFGQESSPGPWALSDGPGDFRIADRAPATSQGAVAAQMFDYDSDGLLIIFLVTAHGRASVLATWDGPGRTRPIARFPCRSRAVETTARILLQAIWIWTVIPMSSRKRGWRVAQCASGSTKSPCSGGNRNLSLRVRLTARVSNRSEPSKRAWRCEPAVSHQKIETAATTPARPAQRRMISCSASAAVARREMLVRLWLAVRNSAGGDSTEL